MCQSVSHFSAPVKLLQSLRDRRKTSMEDFERELQDFLDDCRKKRFTEAEISSICKPLVWHMQLVRLKRWMQWVLVPAVLVYLLWKYCDTCAWTASAVGRLLLIQLLPYWNWTTYYNSRCLIERTDAKADQQLNPSLGKLDTLWENCALCETLESIPIASNVTYSMLESKYLERGLPVIITDCQLELDLNSLLDRLMEKSPQMLESEPCDVSSNLMLRHLFNLHVALEKIPETASWHLQFRNCEFNSVKASRLLTAKPYYYPLHLEPYYSSWLLMAHNMQRTSKDIFVRGLIFVQQLSGHFEWRLHPKEPCAGDICPNLSLRLSSGECLVFSTDLWRLSYGLQQPVADHTSIATLYEVNWKL